jgi:hypothetical protein
MEPSTTRTALETAILPMKRTHTTQNRTDIHIITNQFKLQRHQRAHRPHSIITTYPISHSKRHMPQYAHYQIKTINKHPTHTEFR